MLDIVASTITFPQNHSIASFAKRVLSEFVSFPCPACLKTMPDDCSGLCSECLDRLPLVKNPACRGCGAENDGIFEVCGKCLKEEKRKWRKAVALMRIEDYGRELIHRFKYKNDTALARPFGTIAAELLKKSRIKPDFIVPVPLHWTRSLTRGYNQSQILCQIISGETGIPTRTIMKRIKRTPKQANLSGIQRRKNLERAFSVTDGEICRNSVILIVDDVLTTGSTLTAASSALLGYGAKEINILILARG